MRRAQDFCPWVCARAGAASGEIRERDSLCKAMNIRSGFVWYRISTGYHLLPFHFAFAHFWCLMCAKSAPHRTAPMAPLRSQRVTDISHIPLATLHLVAQAATCGGDRDHTLSHRPLQWAAISSALSVAATVEPSWTTAGATTPQAVRAVAGSSH